MNAIFLLNIIDSFVDDVILPFFHKRNLVDACPEKISDLLFHIFFDEPGYYPIEEPLPAYYTRRYFIN